MDHGWTTESMGREAREREPQPGSRQDMRALRAELEAIRRGDQDPRRYVPNRADRRAAAGKGGRR